MGRKKRGRKARRKKKGGAQQGPVSDLARVEAKLAEGRWSEAVKLARRLCGSDPSDRARELRLTAYLGRAEDLILRGREDEAAALLDTALADHPDERDRVLRRRDYMLAWRGDVDALLAPLADPGLDGERRRQVEREAARWVKDPAMVAGCAVLPADHPLRAAAADVTEALEAVTTYAPDGEEIALGSVARRSPLAGWKMLVRAIDAFYRVDDEMCRRALGAVDDESPPGAVKTAMLDMLEGRTPQGQEGSALAHEVCGEDGTLRASLRALDRALGTGRRREVMKAVREAKRACERERPDLLDELIQRQSITCAGRGYPPTEVRKALGRPSRKDSMFWRLYARQHEIRAESTRDLELLLSACSCWEEAVGHAVAEGVIEAGGPEEAALHLHVASLLAGVPETMLREERELYERRFNGLGYQYEGQDAEVVAAAGGSDDGDFLYPERMFARAARMDPTADVFRRWLGWARGCDHFRPADEAALAWHEALPEDVEPLLFLAQAAEKRNAVKKALRYVQEAERLDAMRSDVRRARARLWLASLRRHIKAGKLHLARKDLAAIDELPGVQEREGRAFVEALRWVVTFQGGVEETAEEHARETARLLDDPVCAEVLLRGGARALGARRKMPARIVEGASAKPTGWWKAATQACGLAGRMQLPIAVEQAVLKKLRADAPPEGLDAQGLCGLGEEALLAGDPDVAFSASGAGLKLGANHAGRFLFLRSETLKSSLWVRRMACLRACFTLARRAGDEELEQRVRGGLRSRRSGGGWMVEEAATKELLQEDLVDRILEFETRSRSRRAGLPRSIHSDMFALTLKEESGEEEDCDCPACRARREGRAPPRDEDGFEDDGYEYEDDDLEEDLPDDGESEQVDVFEVLQMLMEDAQRRSRKKRGR